MIYDDNFSINRRKWRREATQLPAKYFIKKQSTRYVECTIVNLSRSGAGVMFPAGERLVNGSLVFLDLVVPKSFEQLTLKGEIKRNHKQGDGMYGGVQFDAILPDMVLARLTP